MLPAISKFSLRETQKIALNIRIFSIYAGTTGVCGLQENSGLHMEAFVAYCHLQRAGHVVRRHPCLLKHNDGRLVDAHKVWQHSWRDSARVCKAQSVTAGPPPTEAGSVAPTSTTERPSTSGV